MYYFVLSGGKKEKVVIKLMFYNFSLVSQKKSPKTNNLLCNTIDV